jgi:hypothetical protein
MINISNKCLLVSSDLQMIFYIKVAEDLSEVGLEITNEVMNDVQSRLSISWRRRRNQYYS